MSRSPTVEGLRVVVRNPVIGFAEVAWRWAFAGAAWALVIFGMVEYLRTLPVTGGDMLFLRSGQGPLISRAIRHILAGSGGRFMAATFALFIGVALLWVLASSFGRMATLRALVSQILGTECETEEGHSPAAAMLGLQALRVALLASTVLSLTGAAFVANYFSSDRGQWRPGIEFLVFLVLVLTVVALSGTLNRILSIAPIFVALRNQRMLTAVTSAVDFVVRRLRAVTAVSSAFSLIHIAAFVIGSSIVVFPLSFAGFLPGWMVLSATVLLTLIYRVLIDFLHVARMAAYVALLNESEAERSMISYHPAAPPRWPASEDDILSDIPGLALPFQPS
jgi:hypothetical protein